MAQTVTLWGATYNNVPAIDVPSGNDVARFVDPSPTTATDPDVLSGKIYFKADGTQSTGTGTGGGSVTQDANGFIVLPPTGGGGSQYAWFGQGTTYVNRLYSETVNLKDDTTYDSWTASTSSEDIKPVSSTTDMSLTVDHDNVYWLVVRYYVDIAYVSGITLQKVPTNFVYYLVMALNPQYSLYNPLVSNYYNTVVATTVFNKYGFLYYNNSGSLAYADSFSYGPMYCASTPNYSRSGLICDFKFGPIRARCNSTYFDTTQKANIDSANTNMLITVDAYKTPVENTFFAEMQKDMRTDLLS